MRATRLGATCVLLVLAVCAVGVSSAAARLPEWGKCEPTTGGTGGRYRDAACTVKAPTKIGLHSGAYEWHPLAGEAVLKPMTATTPVRFETRSGKTIECVGVGTEGKLEPLGATGAGTPYWEFEGCSSEGQECHAGLSVFAGEISNSYAFHGEPAEAGLPVPGWTGKLGFVSGKGEEDPAIGLSYKVKNYERLFEPIACSGNIGTVWIGGARKGGDAFISTIAPTDQMSSEYTQTYSEISSGVQSPSKFEFQKSSEFLEAFLEHRWEPVAIVATFHYSVEHGESSLEIKAMP
jgi:hypothetical protein